MKRYLFTLIAFTVSQLLFAQVNFTANDQVSPYTKAFKAGVNPGYYGGNWDNFDLTDLSASNEAAANNIGVGIQTIRGILPEHYGIVWDYNNWIPMYQYYHALGIKDNALVVGVAHPDHRDPVDYCPNDPTETTMFANLYEPIWDGGLNGTAINEDNYMAKYVYDLIHTVGDHVKFWEVWNEPGYDLTGYKSSLQPGQPGNWWDNDPDPCDIILRAPIHNYIRTLRITYEVVKFYSPDDYVVLSGIGTDAFLDALMRNTDNPNGGVSPEFPHKSGAYFDVVGFHAYPHFDGSVQHWDNNLGQMVFTRHSDGAVEGFEIRVQERKSLLATYGYDGNTYPNKLLIVTELGVPRQQFDGYFGSTALQQAYYMKILAVASKLGITQTSAWQLAERKEPPTNSFDVMGFYGAIDQKMPGEQTKLSAGVAHGTAAKLLNETVFSQTETNNLNLPNGVQGYAFQKIDGTFVYMLWAKTTTDMSESASASYSFPSSFGATVDVRFWDYSVQGSTISVPAQNITLSAIPKFFYKSNQQQGDLVLDCPSRLIELPAPESAGGAIANWTTPTTSTTCPGGVTLTVAGGSNGGFFPFGTTIVSYKATDQCGNTKRCAFRVAVSSTGGINTSCRIALWDFKFAGQRDGHKYFISKFKKTYQEAVAVAASYGTKLLSIETQAENDFLRYQFTDVGYIGLNDATTEGNLVWESGAPVSFTSYDDCSWCQSNNNTNDFAEFHPWNGKWSFNDGTQPQFFMMEFDCGNPITPTSISVTSFPANINLTVATGSNVNWTPPTATTSCANGAVVITQTAGPTSGSYFSATGSPVTITYSFTDDCGNSMNQSFTVTVSPESTGGGCPATIVGFTSMGEYNGHAYYMSNDNKPFAQAKLLAENQGGYLATINTQGENDFIQSNLGSNMVFIGYNDATTEGAGQWTNNEPVTLDLSYGNSNTNDYAVMNFWAGTWQLTSGQGYRKYILEMDCGGTAGEANLLVSQVNCPINYPIPGSQFPVSVTITNHGAAASTAKPLYFYQKNSTNNGGATNLSFGSFNVPALAAGQSITLSKTFTLTGSFLAESYSNVGGTYPLNYDNFGFSFNQTAIMGIGSDDQTLDYYCKKYNTDLKINVSANNPNYDSNGFIDYQVIVTNNGNDPAYNIRAKILNNLFQNGTTMNGDVTITPVSTILKHALSGMYWYIESLPPGQTKTLNVHYVLPSGYVENSTDFPLSTSVWSGHNTNSSSANDQSELIFNKQTGGESCPSSIDGFTTLGEYNGHKYYLSNTQDNWRNNQATASSNGGYLAVINDASENAFIKNVASSLVHIGFSDSETEGQVQWTNGAPMSYTNYSNCDWCGLNTATNDYGLFLFWDGKWSFDHPWAARQFIMEMDCQNAGGSQPDLTISNITNLPTTAEAGSLLNFNFDLNNIGNTTANGNYNINTYLSEDATFSSNDQLIGNIPTGGTPVGTISAVPNSGALPAGITGSYYLLIIADSDNNIQESNENNNVATVPIQIGAGGGGNSCPANIAGYTKMGEYNGHGYYLSSGLSNWAQARDNAQNTENQLVAITSAGENEFVRSHINSYVLIGLHDDIQEGQLIWQDGAPVGYNQLDNSNSSEQDFGVMNFWNGGWSMVNNQVRKKYVIEKVCASAQAIPVETTKSSLLAIYPNPANDIISMRLKAEQSHASIFNIYNGVGQLMLSQNIDLPKGFSEITLEISKLPAGMYYLRTKGSTNFKFVIMR